MPRLALAVLAAVCLSFAATSDASAATVVIGKKNLYQGGAGWGSSKPKRLYNGGVPNGLIEKIKWRRWGKSSARGNGITYAYKPEGGYYAKPVKIKLEATRLGRCKGGKRRAYTRLIVQPQVKPGGRYDDPAPWSLDLCNQEAQTAPCPPVVFDPATTDGVYELAVWDTDCTMAAKLALAAKPIPLDPGPHKGGSTNDYRFKAEGFTCTGYSFDDQTYDPQLGILPGITWSCLKRTAVVQFQRGPAPPSTGND